MPLKTVKKDAADALTLEWVLHVKNYKLTLDKNRCVGCQVCSLACPKEAIKTQKQPKTQGDKAKKAKVDIDLTKCNFCGICDVTCPYGAIIVSTGFDVYLPYDMPLLGYGKYPNVITSMEFERLILAAGPTGGKVIRQSDGQKPHRIAFIQCVGSRDKNKYPYCSNFCCMYTLKRCT